MRNSETDAIINNDEDDPLPDFDALPRASWLQPILTTKVRRLCRIPERTKELTPYQVLLILISALLVLTFLLDVIVAVDPSLVDDGGSSNSTCGENNNKTLATRLYSRYTMLRSLRA